jgi:hypothetical protein
MRQKNSGIQKLASMISLKSRKNINEEAHFETNPKIHLQAYRHHIRHHHHHHGQRFPARRHIHRHHHLHNKIHHLLYRILTWLRNAPQASLRRCRNRNMQDGRGQRHGIQRISHNPSFTAFTIIFSTIERCTCSMHHENWKT